jgi:SagB-type dehydrogenase family enzyme
MSLKGSLFAIPILASFIFTGEGTLKVTVISQGKVGETIQLPQPETKGKTSLEETLRKRRNVREYTFEAITLEQLGQLLWSCQGITTNDGKRTAPSAGALYPLEVYVVAGKVEHLEPGLYKYLPRQHSLRRTLVGDRRAELCKASLDQEQVQSAAADIVITAVYERTTRKYRDRGHRYVHIEVGHAGQNVCLQAEGLDLGVCTIAAFNDNDVKKVLELANDEEPLYILALGHKKDQK